MEARGHLLNILPRILASLAILWKAIHISEKKQQQGLVQPWWSLGTPKVSPCLCFKGFPLKFPFHLSFCSSLRLIRNISIHLSSVLLIMISNFDSLSKLSQSERVFVIKFFLRLVNIVLINGHNGPFFSPFHNTNQSTG